MNEKQIPDRLNMAVSRILMCNINLNSNGGLDTRNLALKLRSAAVISLNLYVNISLPSKRRGIGIEAAGRRVSLNSCGQLTDNQHFLPVSDEVRLIPAGRR